MCLLWGIHHSLIAGLYSRTIIVVFYGVGGILGLPYIRQEKQEFIGE